MQLVQQKFWYFDFEHDHRWSTTESDHQPALQTPRDLYLAWYHSAFAAVLVQSSIGHQMNDAEDLELLIDMFQFRDIEILPIQSLTSNSYTSDAAKRLSSPTDRCP